MALNGLATRTIFDAISLAMLSAWSLTSVDAGRPRTSERALPYGAVILSDASQDWNGRSTIQKHSFQIVGRFAFEAGSVVDLEKVDRANELIALLQAGPNFATIGILPIVSSISFTESDDVEENAYEVTLTFDVQTVQDHH